MTRLSVLLFGIVVCVFAILFASFINSHFFKPRANTVFWPTWSLRTNAPTNIPGGLHSVFVDSGAFPDGVFSDSRMFASGSISSPTIFSSLFGNKSSDTSRGDCTMWFPAVHSSTGVTEWRRSSFPDQILEPKAAQSLLSVDACHRAGFLCDFSSRCITLHGGWVVPFSSRSDGYFLGVWSGSSPPPSHLPTGCSALSPSQLAFSRFCSSSSCHPTFRVKPVGHPKTLMQAVRSHASATARTASQSGAVVPIAGGALSLYDAPSAPLHRGHNQSVTASTAASRIPVLTTAESHMWRLMGFPFNKQWHWAMDSLGFKSPTSVHMFTDYNVLAARMRALPFKRYATPRIVPQVGQLIRIDFQVGYPPSVPHHFIGNCSLQDDCSGVGRMRPVSRLTAATAIESLQMFHADLNRWAGTIVSIIEVQCDNVPFGSKEFATALSSWPVNPIKLTLTAAYAHAQQGKVERFHGVRAATSNVLLNYARVPRTWWPFAVNQANIIHNSLPSSLDNCRSPIEIASNGRVKPTWDGKHIFGSCSMLWRDPAQRGESAKQVADRAHPAIYLGEQWDGKRHHFFDMKTLSFETGASFKCDYSRSPCGWPLTGNLSVANSLMDLIHIPDYFDMSRLLQEELPVQLSADGYLLSGGVEQLPALTDRFSNVRDAATSLSHAVPLDALADLDIATVDSDSSDDESELHGNAPRRLRHHGTRMHFLPAHCSTSNCLQLYGHPGPCDNMVPASHFETTGVDGPPSLRTRAHAHFATQGRHINRYLLQSAFLNTSVHSAVDNITNTVFETVFNNTVFLNVDGSSSKIPIPKSMRAALNSPHANDWIDAIYREYNSILSHNVFTVVRRDVLPAHANVLWNHLVFTIKWNPDGSVERFKARLVVGGDGQVEFQDFQSTFATVVKMSTFRMGLHLAAVRDYNITSIDISSAFLYGDIDTEVFMVMPEGLPRYDADGNELVCKLSKSLYGLRQAPRIWYQHFLNSLLAWGFIRSTVDPCLFIWHDADSVIYALLWVDDLVLLDNKSQHRDAFVAFLQKPVSQGGRGYKLTDRGECKWIIGIALSRDRAKRQVYLSQELYINTICDEHSVYMDASTVRNFDVPASPEISHYSPADCPAEGTSEHIEMKKLIAVYMKIVGACIWLTTCTRFDACVATAIHSRFTINPAKKHFVSLMRLLIYFRKDASRPLTLGGIGPDSETLKVVTDASHEEGPSLSGVLIIMGSSVIDCVCRRQKSTMPSSMASEAFANALGGQSGIYHRELAKDFDVAITTTDFYSDSDSSIKLHKDYYACKKSKHIVRSINQLREWVMTCVFTMIHIPGLSNPADLLTKPLAIEPFRRYRDAVLGGSVILKGILQTNFLVWLNAAIQSMSS